MIFVLKEFSRFSEWTYGGALPFSALSVLLALRSARSQCLAYHCRVSGGVLWSARPTLSSQPTGLVTS